MTWLQSALEMDIGAEWLVEAGPQYFDETVTAVEKAIQQTRTALKDRRAEPYIRSK